MIRRIFHTKDNLCVILTDNTQHNIQSDTLRNNCPCQICLSSKSRFKILGSNVTILRVEPVGNYGIKVYFSDGHSTGIYTFDQITSLISQQNLSQNP